METMNSQMKSLIALCAGLVLLAGCEKKEATPPAQEPPNAAASQPADMGAMMQKTTDETQKAASQIATATTNAATNLQQEVANAAAKAQETSTQAVDVITNSLTDKTNTVSSITDDPTKIIEAARKLTGENKYDEALKMLGALANSKLTPDQQKMVDSLKEQIQKAMAAKATESATKTVGDLFKK
jgi:hypothetical protein